MFSNDIRLPPFAGLSFLILKIQQLKSSVYMVRTSVTDTPHTRLETVSYCPPECRPDSSLSSVGDCWQLQKRP